MLDAFHRHSQSHVTQVNTVRLAVCPVLTVQQEQSAHQLLRHPQGSAS